MKINTTDRYVDVLFPLAVDAVYTYAVPEDCREQVSVGKRVLAPLGARKWYAGIIVRVHEQKPDYRLKYIRRVLDRKPIVKEQQLDLWRWTADYYACTLGEVMKAALPTGLKLDALQHGESYSDAQWDEIIQETFKPRFELRYHLDANTLEEKQAVLDRSKAKKRCLAFCVQYPSADGWERSVLLEGSGVSPSVLKACVEEGFLRETRREVSRLKQAIEAMSELPSLSDAQEEAYQKIEAGFEEKQVVLLQGITASGKTEIYIRLINDCLNRGKKVLYLVPEIALTAQLIQRLKAVFGDRVGVYHSKFSDQERAEVYLAQAGVGVVPPFPVLLGVRSSVFMPFDGLGLVIVDEEHDTSYKQTDPSPRYNARDLSIVLATAFGAKVLLGSATPAVESYYNAKQGKYALVELLERFGGVSLPRIELVDMKQARKDQATSAHFSHHLLSAIGDAVAQGEQVILFQNRRGYSPYLECPTCGYVPSCSACNVKLTYHKQDRTLVCHYCGQSHPMLHTCPQCKITAMELKGYGTERVEEELKLHLPHLRVGRMDLDTTRRKDAFVRIVAAFENHELDVLIGTQMITKGLDFSRLRLVGVLNADNLLNYPDFRAGERSFQLLSQVAGRAGRRSEQGLVLVQTAMPAHSILQQVLKQDYTDLYLRQMEERADFLYPPFVRLIQVTLKHANDCLLEEGSRCVADELRSRLPAYVLGPERPVIDKVQHLFLRRLLIKVPKETSLSGVKRHLKETMKQFRQHESYKNIQWVLDVDPL